jgi:chromosome segregation ATPase
MDSRPNLTAPSDRSRPAGFARVAAAVVAAGLLSTTAGASPTAPAGDKTLQELQRQREAVRSKRAQAAAQVDATKASDAQVNAALADLNANISSQVSLLEDARRAVAEADQAQKDAAAAEAAAAAELAKVKDDLVEQTKKAFVENEGRRDDRRIVRGLAGRRRSPADAHPKRQRPQARHHRALPHGPGRLGRRTRPVPGRGPGR